MINQAPIVRYTASVCEIFFSDFRKKTFSAEPIDTPDPDSLHDSKHGGTQYAVGETHGHAYPVEILPSTSDLTPFLFDFKTS